MMRVKSSNLVESLSAVLLQLADVIAKVSTDQYSLALPVLCGSSIGKHVRHSLEFVEALLKGRETEIVSYDRRERNLLYEKSPIAASERLVELTSILCARTWSGPMRLSYTADPYSGEEGRTESFWERELLYVQEHTIHHDAMIRIALEHLGTKDVPKSFGFAFSTIQFERSTPILSDWDPVI